MKTKTFNNYLDYINSDENNWFYVELKDFEDAKDKQVKVYFDKQDNEVDVVLINKKKGQ
jgi:outer membrane protein assembly factor BamE (lipoprotein component of BamABCDE complex)